MDDGDDVNIAASGRAAARDFLLRQGDRGFAAQQQGADIGEDALAAVTAMHKPVAVAGLSTPLPPKPQNRPCFHVHSNHQFRTPPPLGAPLLHRTDFTAAAAGTRRGYLRRIFSQDADAKENFRYKVVDRENRSASPGGLSAFDPRRTFARLTMGR